MGLCFGSFLKLILAKLWRLCRIYYLRHIGLLLKGAIARRHFSKAENHSKYKYHIRDVSPATQTLCF